MSWLLDVQEVPATLDGTFTKTTFPAKKPVRRAQVTQLGVTLDKMLAKLDDEDVQKRAEADAKYKEERDAALAVEDGATAEEIEAAQQAGDPDLGDTYYQHWLKALEKIVARKGLLSAEELSRRKDAWDRAAHATPYGEPIELGPDD